MPRVFKTPIPLVAPAMVLFAIVPAAAPRATPPGVVAAPPTVPDITEESPLAFGPPFDMAPTLVPKACLNVESTVTINASIKTCFVFTSIALITASMVSTSDLLPLTIIDRVVFSTVILILLIELMGAAPAPPVEAVLVYKSCKVFLACSGLM